MNIDITEVLHRFFPDDIAIIKQSGQICTITNRYGESIFQDVDLFLHNRDSIECKVTRLCNELRLNFENKGSGVIYITDKSRKHAFYEGDNFQWSAFLE